MWQETAYRDYLNINFHSFAVSFIHQMVFTMLIQLSKEYLVLHTSFEEREGMYNGILIFTYSVKLNLWPVVKKMFGKTSQKVSKFYENHCSFKTFQQAQSWLEQLRKIHFHRASKKHFPNNNWDNKRKTETTRQIDI